MTYADLKQSLEAVAFTTATPFDDDGESVLLDEMKENLRRLRDAGATLFIPCGNTGEYYSLSDGERVDVVQATVEAVGDTATVVAGAGGSTKSVLELADEYEAVGVDGLMVMHPSHAYIHDNGLEEYYRRIAKGTDLGVVLYKRSHEVGDDLIAELSTIDNVVGVKYAVNDIKGFSRAVEETPGDLVWINGIAERFAPSFALEGAEGYTTGIGNFIPEPTLELFEAIESEDWERAKEIRDTLRPLEDLREETGEENNLAAANNVPVVKYGMDLLNYEGGPTREPLVELSTEDQRRVKEYIENVSSEKTLIADD